MSIASLPMVVLDEGIIARTKDNLVRHVFGSGAKRDQRSRHTVRTTYEFGYNYAAMENGDFSFTPIPVFLKHLCAEAIRVFGTKNKELPPAEAFTNYIVSNYLPGFKLQAHVDEHEGKPKKDGSALKYYFGENVLGVILKADRKGRLYFIKSPQNRHPRYDAEKAIPLPERAGLAFSLCGLFRREPYYHGVSEIADHRISVTCRTVHFNK
jgi:hypothetical protein